MTLRQLMSSLQMTMMFGLLCCWAWAAVGAHATVAIAASTIAHDEPSCR
jgi:hypothetical protein